MLITLSRRTGIWKSVEFNGVASLGAVSKRFNLILIQYYYYYYYYYYGSY